MDFKTEYSEFKFSRQSGVNGIQAPEAESTAKDSLARPNLIWIHNIALGYVAVDAHLSCRQCCPCRPIPGTFGGSIGKDDAGREITPPAAWCNVGIYTSTPGSSNLPATSFVAFEV